MGNNYGYQNEYDFVELFNGKYLSELDDNSKNFLIDLFGDNIDDKEMIISWKNRTTQKADIFVKYGKYVKSISLKCGNSNSIHCESVQDFKIYLEKLCIPYKIIDKYISYHYGYMKDINGNINYDMQLSSLEYLKFYQNEINDFNKAINKTRIIVDMIDRFIIRGRNCDYDIDALVCGRIHDYVWILKHDIYDMILSKDTSSFYSPHISCLTIGPKKRNLDRKSRNSKERYIVCVRWNYIMESIINYKKSKGI